MSENLPLIGAALVVTATELNRQIFQQELPGVRGDWSARGQPIGTSKLRYKHDGWRFKVPLRHSYDLNDVVNELRTTTAPWVNRLRRICRENGYEVEVSCEVRMDQQAPALTLESESTVWIGQLAASLDIDVILMDG